MLFKGPHHACDSRQAPLAAIHSSRDLQTVRSRIQVTSWLRTKILVGAVPLSNTTSARRLRSADSLNIKRPRTRLKFGDRGFSAAAPDAWNSLSAHVKSAPSLDVFSDRLKTELFSRSYPLPVA